MATRLDLHALLEKICESKNVYYHPPESLKMNYPAIRYSLSDIKNTFASNAVYNQSHYYKIIVIDKKPDSKIVEKLSKLPGSKFNTTYPSNGLYHTVFTLYY